MAGSLSISESFHAHFQVVPAYSKELRDATYRIRYQVYCEEFGFEDKCNFPDGREIDGFDRHSEHCLLLHRESDRYVGCIRLVLPDRQNPQRSLPFESACRGTLHSTAMELVRRKRGSFGEISRLALLPAFRQRRPRRCPGNADVACQAPETGLRPLFGVAEGPATMGEAGQSGSHRYGAHVGLGLYLAGAAMLINSGLSSMFAMMEPRLARRLRHYGIQFRQVGDVIDYHGLRGPFQISPGDLLTGLCPGPRELLDVLLEQLQHGHPLKMTAS